MLPDCPSAIAAALYGIESGTGIRILYANESGSRAWGFASEDSDWDVRFFYVRPQREYLRIHPHADQMHRDLPGDLDITGWDLRKALHHAGKTSASVLEWLNSPIVYADREGFGAEMRAAARQCFRVRPLADHYLGLARQLWLRAAEGGGTEGELNGKKCLYVLRATLCARWALDFREPPPVVFATMLPLVEDAAMQAEIRHFTALKIAGSEADSFPVSPELRRWLEEARLKCEADAGLLREPPPDVSVLDDLFLSRLA